LKTETPAIFIRKDAEQLFERQTARTASSFVQRPLRNIFVTNTAPDGKPENKPRSTPAISVGGTPKSLERTFRIRFSFVISGMTQDKKAAANTKGKSDGTSVVKQISSAFFV